MGYAVRNRENLRGLVVMNTWAWPASMLQIIFSFAMGGWPLGYYLQTRRNFFAKSMLPDGIFRPEKVTATFRKAYTDPFPTPESRIPTWIFPRQIRKARHWLAEIESKLPVLSDLPAQIVWGMHDDPGFPAAEMKKWQSILRLHETEQLKDASHSVQEDRPDRVAAAIRRAIERSSR
jgi:haloalkane dehalogenase